MTDQGLRATRRLALAGVLAASILGGSALGAASRPAALTRSVVLSCANGAGVVRCSSDARTQQEAQVVWRSISLQLQPKSLDALSRLLAKSFGGKLTDARVVTTTHGRALAALGIRYVRQGVSRGTTIVLPSGGVPVSRPVLFMVLRGRFSSLARLPVQAQGGTVLGVAMDRQTRAILDIRLARSGLRLSVLPPLRPLK
jgi:hypothetical protein